ncbi:PIN domain-like protein, partial [Paxillus ammoniavirescens]
ILLHATEKRSLREFAANEGFHSQGGPGRGLKLLTIGVDASTWMHSVCAVFHYNHAGAGPNPKLHTLFYRLAALLAMPVHAFFVFDGHRRPSTKRGKQTGGKSHWLSNGFQELLDAFGFRLTVHQAPGEAEAELAALSQRRFIDMVLTMDNDALIFGATCVARCPDNPRHFDNIEIYTEHIIAGSVRLTRADQVLIALVSGGDYSDGIQGCGIKIAHLLSQYKLGKALLNAFSTMQQSEFTHFLRDWQDDLRRVLETDPGGFLGRKYVKIAGAIPNSFPDYDVLQSYASPLTTFSGMGESPAGSPCPYPIDSHQPHLSMLAAFCERHFGWKNEGIVIKLHTTIWEGAALRLMCRV